MTHSKPQKTRLVITLRDDADVSQEEIVRQLCDKGMVLLHPPLKNIPVLYGEMEADYQSLSEVEGVVAVEPEGEMYA